MYSLFAEAIRGRADRAATGSGRTRPELPTFDTAVGLHRFLDTIRQSSDTGRELEVRR
jgi:predicted dehydrogenase